MSPNTIKMVPIQVDANVPKNTTSSRRKHLPTIAKDVPKKQRNQQVPVTSARAKHKATQRESLSDSELIRAQGDNYAGAKFSEAPLPNFLPMPPQTWLGNQKKIFKAVPKVRFAASLVSTSSNRTVSARKVNATSLSTLKSASFVPCQIMTNELKVLLKVEC